MIKDVVTNGESKVLGNDRVAFWKGTVVVIRNPKAKDLGTAFAPTSGKKYFDALK
jgi:hypothetical protein